MNRTNVLFSMVRQQVLQRMRRRYLAKSSVVALPSVPKEKRTYEEFINDRQAQATRSIVVQVNSEKSFPELYSYCQNFGKLIGAFHYSVKRDDEQHYILVEFSNNKEAAAAIDSSSYNPELTGVPVRSPFLWFKAIIGKNALKKPDDYSQYSNALDSINGMRPLDGKTLSSLLQNAINIDEQISILHERTQLNDLGVRMRFLAALQVQQAVSGMFPDANAQPFGSSVNGFGKMGCDLDLILRFDREKTSCTTKRKRDSRLIYHTKENLSNGRSQTQRQMESVGDILYLFLPGVSQVRRILQARVPIIKYHHDHLNLEVDLSMSNLTGFYMSELLYMFGEFDERVRPLIFCIRRWASSCGLTNPSPGRWISNFSITCLVVFFLQQLKQPILPTLNALMKAVTQDDIRITEDGINCSFARDFKRIGFISRNNMRTSELLLQFFEYFSQFDFDTRAISLNDGRPVTKPDHCALYIVNPLETNLNVSKNVSFDELERIRIEMRNAAWVLESEFENLKLKSINRHETPWGLMNVFKTHDTAVIKPTMFYKPRMVEISELFDKKEGGLAKLHPQQSHQQQRQRHQQHPRDQPIREQEPQAKQSQQQSGQPLVQEHNNHLHYQHRRKHMQQQQLQQDHVRLKQQHRQILPKQQRQSTTEEQMVSKKLYDNEQQLLLQQSDMPVPNQRPRAPPMPQLPLAQQLPLSAKFPQYPQSPQIAQVSGQSEVSGQPKAEKFNAVVGRLGIIGGKSSSPSMPSLSPAAAPASRKHVVPPKPKPVGRHVARSASVTNIKHATNQFSSLALKSKPEPTTPKIDIDMPTSMVYKNADIRKQVQKIKAAAREEIIQMRTNTIRKPSTPASASATAQVAAATIVPVSRRRRSR